MTILRLLALTALLGFTLLFPGVGGPLAAACIWALCLIVLAYSHPKGMLSLECLYLLLLGVFHLGLVVPDALGLGPSERPDWLRSPYLSTALGMFSTATIAFTIGAVARGPASLDEETTSLRPQPELFWIGSLAAAVGAVLLWLGVRQMGMLSGGYSSFYERAMTEDVRFFGFGLMLFPVGLLVAAAGARPGRMLVLAGALLVVMGPLFLGGFRGPMITQGIALLAVWVHKEARFARRLAIVGSLCAIAVIPAIRMSRNLQQGLSQGMGKFDPLAVLHETGGSVRPLVITAERVYSGAEPLWMGSSYVMAARRVVPNLSSRWTAQRRRELLPSEWATAQVDQWLLDRGGSIGFSGVAEPYLNFGMTGILVFFFLLGVILRSAGRQLARNPFIAAIAAASFGALLWTVRNEATGVPRVVAVASAIVFSAWLVARLRRRSSPVEDDAELEPSYQPER